MSKRKKGIHLSLKTLAGARRLCYKRLPGISEWGRSIFRYDWKSITGTRPLGPVTTSEFSPDCEPRRLGNLLEPRQQVEISVKPLIASQKRADVNAAGPRTFISGNWSGAARPPSAVAWLLCSCGCQTQQGFTVQRPSQTQLELALRAMKTHFAVSLIYDFHKSRETEVEGMLQNVCVQIPRVWARAPHAGPRLWGQWAPSYMQTWEKRPIHHRLRAIFVGCASSIITVTFRPWSHRRSHDIWSEGLHWKLLCF